MAGRKQERKNDVIKKLIPRGFLESYILFLLKKEPVHGYLIMKRIKGKTGFWKPSPGTVYPALHSLEKKGFIILQRHGRTKKYALTEKGRKLSAKIGNIQKTMKDKMSDVLSDILEIEKGEFLSFFERLKDDGKKGVIFSRIHKMIMLIAGMPDSKSSLARTQEVLDETNAKLSEIAGRRVKK